MLSKAIRLTLGVLFLPTAIGFSLAFYEQVTAVREVGAAEILFLLGVTAYLAFHVLVSAPTRAYVLGHELMHASATWLSGGKVQGFHVGSKSGSVVANKVTSLIALAPYLVPIYAVLLSLLFAAAGLFWEMTRWTPWFFFGLGATLAFHLVFTINSLKEKQSDLEVVGPLLGLGLILWTNLTIMIGVMDIVVPEIHFGSYLVEGFQHARSIYGGIFVQLFVR